MGDRYTVERARRFGRLVWFSRGRLTDTQTGDIIELQTEKLAEEVRAVLELDDDRLLERLPVDASPFRRYETTRDWGGGWHYLWRADGAADHQAIGRTKSEPFLLRIADALNRANPRKLRDPHGPIKAVT